MFQLKLMQNCPLTRMKQSKEPKESLIYMKKAELTPPES